MGNICFGSKGEASKGTAFETGDDESAAARGGYSDSDHRGASSLSARGGLGDAGSGGAKGSSSMEASGGGSGGGSDGKGAGGHDSTSGGDPEQLRVVKQEQARLEWIVQATGRRMLGVRTNRGSQGYYVDQGFAAALYQHLEQTTSLPARLPSGLSNLPTSGSSSSSDDLLYRRLTAPTWESFRLHSDGYGGGGGGGGKNPVEDLDHVAETFLDEVVPKKSLFADTEPVVEILI